MLGHDVLAFLLDAFWRAFGYIDKANAFLPHFGTTGFLVSFALILAGYPFLLLMALRWLWAIASVGPVRKSMSTVFIVFLSVPLYPLLSMLGLAIIWIVLSIAVFCAAALGPVFPIITMYTETWSFVQEHVEKEASRKDEGVAVEDINCGEFFLGLFMGFFSMCTFGILSGALTLLKAPVVILASVFHYFRHAATPLSQTGCWCPLAFLGLLCVLAGGLVVLVLVIAVSAVCKVVIAGVWSAYVSAAWLRMFISARRRRGAGCCTPLMQGLKAGYQVLWAADMLTNAAIIGRFDLLSQARTEFMQLATSQRDHLSPECRFLTCLPPVVIGLAQGSWDINLEHMARRLGVSKHAVSQAWRSFAGQMERVGLDALEEGLLTEDYVSEVPPELIVGLPARVLLDTVQRSRNDGEIIEASGLRVTELSRPRGRFEDKAWAELMKAQQALKSAKLDSATRVSLAARLLAGGGEPGGLPAGLAQAVQAYEAMPANVKDACNAIYAPLIAVAYECSRRHAFKEQLQQVIMAL